MPDRNQLEPLVFFSSLVVGGYYLLPSLTKLLVELLSHVHTNPKRTAMDDFWVNVFGLGCLGVGAGGMWLATVFALFEDDADMD